MHASRQVKLPAGARHSNAVAFAVDVPRVETISSRRTRRTCRPEPHHPLHRGHVQLELGFACNAQFTGGNIPACRPSPAARTWTDPRRLASLCTPSCAVKHSSGLQLGAKRKEAYTRRSASVAAGRRERAISSRSVEVCASDLAIIGASRSRQGPRRSKTSAATATLQLEQATTAAPDL